MMQINLTHQRLSKYPIDKRPTLATFVEVNLWSTALNSKMMKIFTDCKNYENPIRNLVSSTSVWNITSLLIKPIEVDLVDIFCTEENKSYDLFIPGFWSKFDA